MKIALHAYSLHPTDQLHGRSPRPRRGALLRVHFDDGAQGFADVHPWPEFGHETLAAQIAGLRAGRLTAVTGRSLFHARRDAEARANGTFLFDNLPMLESHALVPDPLRQPVSHYADLVAAGYRVAKLKCGNDLDAEAELMGRLLTIPWLRWRLDFNAAMDSARLLEWILRLDPDRRSRIEFLEDPTPYEAATWEQLSREHDVALALDWSPDPLHDDLRGIEVLVIKPACQDAHKLADAVVAAGRKIVVTHCRDHPLGRAAALWTASSLRKLHGEAIRPGGLQGRRLYQETAFADRLRETGPWTLPYEGTGFGFDDLLAQLEWEPLFLESGAAEKLTGATPP